jgi:hypothetical protein
MRTLCIVGVFALASACSSYGGLRCDGHLQPINAPRPAAGVPAQKTPAPTSADPLVKKP